MTYTMIELVCARCDVSCREECSLRDKKGKIIQRWTRCSYCGRTELRIGKLGHPTPVPNKPTLRIVS
jgi:hypothetical protein